LILICKSKIDISNPNITFLEHQGKGYYMEEEILEIDREKERTHLSF